jgi:hypothetical protein
MSDSIGECQTCYGTGEIVTEHGPVDCPDCYGDGKAAHGGTKMEWRLRDIEKTYRAGPGRKESLTDIMWLVHELRQAREALVLILTRCQDADESDEMAKYVRNQAMAALGLYERTSDQIRGSREKA